MGSEISSASVPLKREEFLLDLLRELSGTLEHVVGLDDAEGYISLVGQKIGAQIDQSYKSSVQVENLSKEQVGEVLVDLKRRIQGDFYVVEETDKHIVFGNRQCPFGDRVNERPSLCMMTSNVFGHIASENLKYAKVELQETIATGSSECRVVVHFEPNEAEGREYYKRS